MPNRNYVNGRNFEYKVKKEYESIGWKMYRTAGSRGEFDLIGIRSNNHTLLVQCKRVKTMAQAYNLIDKFKDNPPLERHSNLGYIQILEVYIKNSPSFPRMRVETYGT